MSERLLWERDGRNWPHHAHSQFVDAAGLRWHVQQWPRTTSASNPAATPAPESAQTRQILLLHGTGASTHSWRGLAPLLAEHADVLALDLPGHAFTSMPAGGTSSVQLSLPGMAAAVAALLQTLGLQPTLVLGHSAGAAVALRMALDGLAQPHAIVGINAALLPLRGLAGQLFSPVAKLMAGSTLVPRFFSSHAGEPAVLKRLLESTGSSLDAEGMALYGQLVSNPGHAAGALGMMANWDLQTLADQLPRLAIPLDLLVGSRDHTVPPAQADRVLARLQPGLPATLTRLAGLGHLAHEEQPGLVAELLRAKHFSAG